MRIIGDGMVVNYRLITCLLNLAVKRLLREAQEMALNDESHLIHAQPLEDNLFEWHFTFRGPPDSVYSNGIYHGRVIFPSQYPLAPPEIALLTVIKKLLYSIFPIIAYKDFDLVVTAKRTIRDWDKNLFVDIQLSSRDLVTFVGH